MVYNKINCVLVLLVFFKLTHGESGQVSENDYLHEKSVKPVGKFYSVTTCNYNAEPGYMCIGCKRALHCYPTNLAILVDCNGVFRPYCYEGRCSPIQGSKCISDGTKSTPAPAATNLLLGLSPATYQEIIKLTEAEEVASNLTEVSEVVSELTEAEKVDSTVTEANEVASKLTEINEVSTNLKLSQINEDRSPS